MSTGLRSSCLLALSPPLSRWSASEQVTGWSPSSCCLLREDFQDKAIVIRKLRSRAGKRWAAIATVPRADEDGARGKKREASVQRNQQLNHSPWGEDPFVPHLGKIFGFLTRAF